MILNFELVSSTASVSTASISATSRSTTTAGSRVATVTRGTTSGITRIVIGS